MIRAEHPRLTYAEAVGIAKRAPNGDQMTIRRESMALEAAKANPQPDFDTALATYRKQYGLGAPQAGTAGAVPQSAGEACPDGSETASPAICGRTRRATSTMPAARL